MSQLVKQDGQAELSEKQRAFVAGLLRGEDQDEAKANAGYSDSVHPSQVMASAAVRKAIQEACVGELQGAVRIEALNAIKDMLKPSTPAATRFQAAKWVMEQGDEDSQADDKPMSAMTADELAALVDRLERERTERNAQMRDVTPRNGA